MYTDIHDTHTHILYWCVENLNRSYTPNKTYAHCDNINIEFRPVARSFSP